MLQCDSVSVVYSKKIQALYDVSLVVKQGEIVAFIGANGSGKSTFLKTVSGLLKVESGTILFQGQRIHHLPAHKISALGIAHVPEGRRIFSRLTVRENLELGAYLDGEKMRERLDKNFSLFPILKERQEQLGGTLSGGEQQMLAIARALMSDPKLLMLDEPSMGLAPIFVERIFQTIRQINALGTTILLVEQNAHQTLSLAHRAYVLQTGKIVLEGSGPSLLKNELVQNAYLGN
ncbi:MAG: ABC transporter ATP-binding protein [Elusimicrobia bacterium]|nr:ABC transporter ATP-binding protein [Elusimicrobiota bacterium]MBI3013008.1 ABC transporter ATP-binding protein [Elusimicrobiota bacterium]MBI4218043.1 ABC transporter ATP-binding protein [Elusimicrobiota bacterium]